MRLNAYQLKCLAIVGMFTNHAVIALHEVIPFALQFPLFALGGLTFPIMAFFVVEGYKHTSNLKRYIGRLVIFGVLAQLPYMLAFREMGMRLNIMFTIILGLLLLLAYDRLKNRVLFWVLFALALVVSTGFDWPVIGVIVVILYRVISNESTRRVWPSVAAGIAMLITGIPPLFMLNSPQVQAQLEATGVDANFMIVNATFMIGCFAAAFFVRGFNGERGKQSRWLFYVFYPLHLAVLGAIALALGLTSFWMFGL